MSHISYTDNVTVVPAAWLNDVDVVTYTYFGNGTSRTGNLTVPGDSAIFGSTGVDVSTKILVRGTSKAVRIGTGSASGNVEAVDNTGSISFQPLFLNGSTVDIGTSGTARLSVAASGVVTIPVSVVTPLVKSPTTSDFTLGTTDLGSLWVIQNNNGFLRPAVDNTIAFGSPTNRIQAVFTPIIDSGTTGSLSLQANNGEVILDLIRPAAVVANRWTMQGGASGSSGVSLFPTGGDANITAFFTSRGTGGHTFQTNIASPVVQLQVLHTASANRNITVTGSNGGSPTINTTAGTLAIAPGTVFGSSIGLGGTNPAGGGNGITFPAAQSASSDANTLDDYEEGTWTPSVGGTATYVTQSGTYTKIGRAVYVKAKIVINTIGTGSTITISGLPFTSTSEFILSARHDTAATAIVSLVGSTNISATTISLLSKTAAAVSDTSNAIFGNGATVYVSGYYETT